MYTNIARKLQVVLLLLWVSALTLVPSATATGATSANADQTQARSMLSTLPYIRQLCPGDVVQGEVPLRARGELWTEIQNFYDTGNATVFENADLHYFYGEQGDEVRVVIHPLTTQMDVAVVINTGFDTSQRPLAFADGWPGEDMQVPIYSALSLP